MDAAPRAAAPAHCGVGDAEAEEAPAARAEEKGELGAADADAAAGAAVAPEGAAADGAACGGVFTTMCSEMGSTEAAAACTDRNERGRACMAG